jgi:hypothetical protein
MSLPIVEAAFFIALPALCTALVTSLTNVDAALVMSLPIELKNEPIAPNGLLGWPPEVAALATIWPLLIAFPRAFTTLDTAFAAELRNDVSGLFD